MARIGSLWRRRSDEGGFTLIEVLVAATMGVVLMGAVASLVIGALRFQPRITKKAENVSTARYVLERMTRELRSGEKIEAGSASEVVFVAYERHSPCGGTTLLPAGQASVPCKITYSCTTTSCSRTEAAPGSVAGSGTTRLLFSGINSNQVFSFQPVGPVTEATYVKVTFRMPDPQGSGSLKVSDGASLRNATLSY
ncbi:MAG TPA: type II secretion system protein [Solirubrobacterales bacterium]|nr:type II secretion system protein [Solirubrobacterales bacterium]